MRSPTADITRRLFLVGLGGATIAWSLYAFPIFWHQAAVEQTARHIIAGDFKPGVLAAITANMSSIKSGKWDHPSVLGSVASIRLRRLEQAIAEADQKAIDAQEAQLNVQIRSSLSFSPADAFLWLVLFWLENSQNGFSREHLKYLRMSYLTGPNEGWIALKRSRLALAIFSELSPDISKKAIREFAMLVDSHFIAEASEILTGPGWRIRNTLLSELKDVSVYGRQEFAKAVYKLGANISVPGVAPQEFRPWN